MFEVHNKIIFKFKLSENLLSLEKFSCLLHGIYDGFTPHLSFLLLNSRNLDDGYVFFVCLFCFVFSTLILISFCKMDKNLMRLMNLTDCFPALALSSLKCQFY